MKSYIHSGFFLTASGTVWQAQVNGTLVAPGDPENVKAKVDWLIWNELGVSADAYRRIRERVKAPGFFHAGGWSPEGAMIGSVAEVKEAERIAEFALTGGARLYRAWLAKKGRFQPLRSFFGKSIRQALPR